MTASRHFFNCTALVLASTLHSASLAQVFVSEDGSGDSIVLSNFRSVDAPRLLIAATGEPADALHPNRKVTATRQAADSSARRLPPSSPEVRKVIDEVAVKVGISPDLLHAVIAAESRYDSRALSPRGAIGLMQLMPDTARRFGAQDPYAPHQNVLAGAQYLKWLMGFFQDDIELVLAAYNAGEQAVVRAGRRIPPYAETQAYVPRVLAYLRCAATVAACKPA